MCHFRSSAKIHILFNVMLVEAGSLVTRYEKKKTEGLKERGKY